MSFDRKYRMLVSSSNTFGICKRSKKYNSQIILFEMVECKNCLFKMVIESG